ncbi:MAG TPA: 50S ribosomal protein L9, partial [Micromonosporaceae bacterium]|nr:50S ribosomal protein L9 [Micromonosporaceae bacterium]
DAVKAAGGPVLDKRKIELSGPIKTTGGYTVQIKLHSDVTAKFNLNVVAAK